MMLWISIVTMTVLSLVVLWPVLKSLRGESPDTYAARLRVLRDRRAELDAEFAAGGLDAEQHAAAVRELEGLAADELRDGADHGSDRARPILHTYIGIAVVVPLVAFTMYLSVGGYGEVDAITAPPERTMDLPTLLRQLEQRMADNPDDLQGWMLLGRSSVVTGNYPAAVSAWREASRLAPEDPTVLANLAEALALDDPETMQGEAGLLFERALALDPDNPKALWYGGILADNRGEPELAARRWETLLAQDPPAEFRRLIQERLGLESGSVGFRLQVGVTAAPGMDETGPTLFVTVHDPDTPTAPPLAAVQVRVDDLPTEVVVDDRAVMLPGTVLSGREMLRVVARLSATGSVERQAGDVYGEAMWEPDTGNNLQVVIDRRVE